MPSLFSPPKDMVEVWARKIPRKDRKLTSKDCLCEKHFPEEDILRVWSHKGPDGEIVEIPREKPALAPGAIPCIFPNLPAYYTVIPKKRKPPLQRTSSTTDHKKIAVKNTEVLDWQTVFNALRNRQDMAPEMMDEEEEASGSEEAGYNVHANAKQMTLPPMCGVCHRAEEVMVTMFCFISPQRRQMDKCVEFTGMSNCPKLFIRNQEFPLTFDPIMGNGDVERLLMEVHNMRLCLGTSRGKYHYKCTGYLALGRRYLRCLYCNRFHKTMERKLQRQRNRQIAGVKMLTHKKGNEEIFK